ncbi:hypothetical protein, partial [Salmonella sp. s55004]|uniref:hypothetical protein n=1 Tax=Salmonella sp. s55004 TaxID=3159675 RepID=UPI003980ABEA
MTGDRIEDMTVAQIEDMTVAQIEDMTVAQIEDSIGGLIEDSIGGLIEDSIGVHPEDMTRAQTEGGFKTGGQEQVLEMIFQMRKNPKMVKRAILINLLACLLK